MKSSVMTIAIVLGATVWWIGSQDSRATEPANDGPSRATRAKQPHRAPKTGRTFGRPTTSVTPGRIIQVDEPTHGPDALEIEHPIRLLPADTIAAAWTEDFAALSSQLGLRSLLGRHRSSLKSLDDELAKVGLDLLDLANPTELGIDAEAPAMMALMGLDRPVVVFAGRIGDLDRLENTLETFAAGLDMKYRREVMNDADVIMEDNDRPYWAFMSRGGYQFALIAESRRADMMNALSQLAWQEPEHGLPTADGWLESVPQVQGDAGMIFINAPAIHAKAAAEIRKDLARGRQELENTPDEPWVLEHQEREEGAYSLFEAVFGSFGGAAFGFEFEEGRIKTDGRIALGPGSMMSRLFRNSNRQTAIQRALDVAPVFLMDGVLDANGLRSFVELFAAAVGADLERGMAMAQGFAGLDRSPLEYLNGEFGLAVTVEDLLAEKPTWGVTLTAGVTDAGKAQQAIDRVSTLSFLSGLIEAEDDTGGVAINTPHWRKLHLAVIGDVVALTTDKGVLARMTWGSGRLATAYQDIGVSQLLGRWGNIGRIAFDFDAMTPMFRPWMPDPMEPIIPEDATPEMTEMLWNQYENQKARYDAKVREQDLARSLIGLLGDAAATLRIQNDTLVLQGGLFSEAPTISDLLAGLVDGAVAIEENERTADVSAAMQAVETRVEVAAPATTTTD